MKEKLLKIINHYGVSNQQRKLEEEVFELQEAIRSYEYNSILKAVTDKDIRMDRVKEHLEEETGDVLNVIYEFIEYYELDLDKITDSRIYKIDREIKRIENARNN